VDDQLSFDYGASFGDGWGVIFFGSPDGRPARRGGDDHAYHQVAPGVWTWETTH
jgi:hypothetical protein